jgi:hypothetical protein
MKYNLVGITHELLWINIYKVAFNECKYIYVYIYTQGEQNFFPDYKHLLQENYVEYKHFLPLLKLVSKKTS